MSAEARAARLVRLVEGAIERGEFTPQVAYLHISERLGPCGCAKAAAQFVSGINPGRVLPRDVPGLDDDEKWALEGGYEGYDNEHRRSPAFYAAGRELRKFHPRPVLS